MRFGYKRLVTIIGLVIALFGYHPTHSQDGSQNWTLPDLQVITPANAANLEYLGSLGYGAFPYPTWSPDSQTLLITTTAGIWVYAVADVGNPILIPDLNGVLGFVADGTAFLANDIWGKAALVELDTLQRTQPVAPPASLPDYTYFLNPDAPPLGQWTTTSPDGRYLVTERPANYSREKLGRRETIYRITDTTTREIVGQVIGIDRFSFYTYSGHYFTPQFLDSGFLYIRNFKLWRWNPSTRREELLIDRINDYVISPDGRYMVLFSIPPFNSTPMTLTLWDISGPHATRLFEQTFPGNDPWGGFAISPDGQEVALGGSNFNIRRWSLPDRGQTLSEDRPPSETGETWVYTVDYSPDGQWLADCRRGISNWSACDLREAATGLERATIGFPNNIVEVIKFHPTEPLVAIGLEDGSIRFWAIDSLLAGGDAVDFTRPDRIFTGHSGPVLDLAFSADGSRLVSGSEDNSVGVWDWELGLEIQLYRDYSDAINTVAITSDGKFILTGSHDGTVRLREVDAAWDAPVPEPIITFPTQEPPYVNHMISVDNVTFSPDDRLTVAAHVSDGIYLWDTTTSELLTRLPVPEAFCSSCPPAEPYALFNPEGTLLIVVIQRSGVVQLWGVPN